MAAKCPPSLRAFSDGAFVPEDVLRGGPEPLWGRRCWARRSEPLDSEARPETIPEEGKTSRRVDETWTAKMPSSFANLFRFARATSTRRERSRPPRALGGDWKCVLFSGRSTASRQVRGVYGGRLLPPALSGNLSGMRRSLDRFFQGSVMSIMDWYWAPRLDRHSRPSALPCIPSERPSQTLINLAGGFANSTGLVAGQPVAELDIPHARSKLLFPWPKRRQSRQGQDRLNGGLPKGVGVECARRVRSE